MAFKTELINGIQLFFLLCLLFWSFTWNSSSNHDFPHPNTRLLKPQTTSTIKTYDWTLVNKHSVLLESLTSMKYDATRKESSDIQAVLPPFNEWKEKEMTKYGKGSFEDKRSGHSRKLILRKLNYSSSKCGAKILASNKEARHKTAVLNEKGDEYMLNPCRIRTWFVIELCDAVEVTQIELANYELYSSSPKQFSVFWSADYPTMMWHNLGIFEAKDKRTMQTFDINKKNLGKFIKIVIYNHHGMQHYCPLSVIRVLGYSMVQEFEAIEDSKNNQELPANDESGMRRDEKNRSSMDSLQTLQEDGTSDYRNAQKLTPSLNTSFSTTMCSLYSIYCFDLSSKITENKCYGSRACTFLVVIAKSSIICKQCICSRDIKALDGISHFVKRDSENNVSYSSKCNETNLNNKYGVCKRVTKISDLYMLLKGHNRKLTHLNKKYDCNATSKEVKSTGSGSTSFRVISSKDQTSHQNIYVNTGQNLSTSNNNSKNMFIDDVLENRSSKNEVRIKSVNHDSTSDRGIEQLLSDDDRDSVDSAGDSVDSAGLIQKESVLIKLSSRIKASETELNLINVYLQQLSQTYRQEMDDIRAIFHQTVKAIEIASEKASVIDDEQQNELKSLQVKVNSLNQKVKYLVKGQKDLLIRVVELHGFFLIMELIIISTIFTIFLNIIRRKNALFEKKQKLGFLKTIT